MKFWVAGVVFMVTAVVAGPVVSPSGKVKVKTGSSSPSVSLITRKRFTRLSMP